MKDIFCAKCQQVTPHKASVDGNGEFLFECQVPGCDRFLKLPADFPGENLDQYLSSHREANQGQVNMEGQEKKLADMLSIPGVQEVQE